MTLEIFLRKHKESFSPLFSPDLITDNTLFMDFQHSNPELEKLDFADVEAFNAFVFDKIAKENRIYGYGGYLEDREIYRRSALFSGDKGQLRSIHLGIDVWIEAGKEIHCPLDAKVHSFQNNAAYGDYGPTIILEHDLEGTVFYSLYGHLSIESLNNLEVGKKIKKGEVFCTVGSFPINGDWPPHLHFQVIADMKDKKGDYYGVCSKEDIPYFKNLCPNPVVFFNF